MDPGFTEYTDHPGVWFYWNTVPGAVVTGVAGYDLNNWGSNAIIYYGNATELYNDSRAVGSKVYGNEQANFIDSDADNVYIDARAGNDVLSGCGFNVTMIAGDGDDLIRANAGSNVTIFGGTGNDTIVNWWSGDKVKINAGADNDSIVNEGSNVSINGGKGNDSIENFGSTVTIIAGANNDSITNDGSKVTIDAGKGKDIIENRGSKVSINATVDNKADFIANSGSTVTILAGNGNDFIYNYGFNSSKVTIDTGKGKDTIENSGSKVSINATADNKADSISNSGSTVTILAGAGNDSITNDGSKVTIDAGEGNDKIYSKGSNVSINGGNGDNLISLTGGKNISLKTGADTDSIVAEGLNIRMSIESGEGNNLISLLGSWGYTGNFVSVKGGENEIYVAGEGNTVVTGTGNSTVKIDSNYNSIVAGAKDLSADTYDDNFIIFRSGNENTVETGYGSDTVWTTDQSYDTTIDTGYGNDSIRNEGNYISVNSGYSNDTIKNYGEYVTIAAGDIDINAGENFITNYADHVTVSGGGDKDTISNSGQGVSINAGAGNDIISLSPYIPIEDLLHSVIDPLKPLAKEVLAQTLGLDLFETLDDLQTLSDNKKSSKEKAAAAERLSDTAEDLFSSDKKEKLLQGSKFYTDLKPVYSTLKRINKLTRVLELSVQAYVTYSQDKLFPLLAKEALSDFEKDDNGHWVFKSKTFREPVTVRGGKGNDEIYKNGGFSVYEYTAGDGDDTIYGWNFNDTLKIYGGTYSGKIVGNDYVVTVGNGSIIFKDMRILRAPFIEGYESSERNYQLAAADNQNSAFSSEEIFVDDDTAIAEENFSGEINANDYYAQDVTRIDASKAGDVDIIGSDSVREITSGKGNDNILNITNSSTIKTGAGKDLILNFGDNSEINASSGNDIVINIGDENTIETGKGKDTIISDGKKNVFLCDGSGNKIIYGFNAKDTLQIAESLGTYSKKKSGKNIVVTVGKNKVTLAGAASLSAVNINNEVILTDKTKSTLKVGKSIKIIDASARTKAIKITGNSKANLIIGGSKKDTLYGGKGNDSIVGNAGNDKLFGQKGNDTLWGGKGNDSLWGDAGADTFYYALGDGKDIIYGFENDDLLKITGAFTASYNKKYNSVTFKMDSGSITLKKFTATTFHVNNSIYTISGSSFKKQ